MPSGRNDIWITGVGCATPLGCDFRTLTDNVLAGRSGVAEIERFPTSELATRIAALVPEIPCPGGFTAERFASYPASLRMLLWSASTALVDAGLSGHRRVGLVVGLGAEAMQAWERDEKAGGDAIGRLDADGAGLVDQARNLLELTGPSTTVAAACASGNVALGVGRRWIEMGFVDVVLAGGVDAVSPLMLAGFSGLRTLSRRNDDPRGAARPFDVDRDGFVLGEGAALVVLESGDRARRRRAIAHGRLLGHGFRNDAFSLVAPSNDPSHAAAAVAAALADAGMSADDIDYVNAHAPGTAAGDAFETRVLRHALGSAIDRVPVSSTKSMTGHLISAASAVEAVISLAALARQAAPPTINLHRVDPACDLNHVPHQSQPRQIDAVLSTSFGFGGSNTAVILGRAA